MSLTVAGIHFSDHEYDERGDVLYLSVGPPSEPERTVETPEAHAVHYDSDGAVIGLTLMAVRFTLREQGELVLSLPPAHVGEGELSSIVAAA